MSKRLDVTNQAFATLNLVLGLFGFYDQTDTIIHFKRLFNTAKAPFFVEAFYAMSSINLVFAFSLALSGYLLLRRRANAVGVTLFIFAAEIAYLVSIVPISSLHGLGFSVASAAGGGNMALTAQLLGAYQLIGFVILGWVKRSSMHPVVSSQDG
jgi:hypothetical protein